MHFIDELFDLFAFSEEQRTMALNDLELFISAATAKLLLTELSADQLAKIEKINDVNDASAQKKVADSLKQNFSKEKIKEAEKVATGQVIISYLDHMLHDLTPEQKKTAQTLFDKYGIKLTVQ